MDPFEKKLKSLAPCKPSEDLRMRIFGEPQKKRNPGIFTKRISLSWAFALALIMWICGFFAARILEKPRFQAPLIQPSVTNVRIIYEAPTKQNLFDFTEVSSDFFPGNVKVRVQTNGEV